MVRIAMLPRKCKLPSKWKRFDLRLEPFDEQFGRERHDWFHGFSATFCSLAVLISFYGVDFCHAQQVATRAIPSDLFAQVAAETPVDATDPDTSDFDEEARSDEILPADDDLSQLYNFPHWSDELKAFSVVSPKDERRTPYSLNMSVFLQPRWTGFSRANEQWTNAMGNVQKVQNMDYIELNRAQLAVSGFAYDPKLRYSFIAFTSSSSNLFLPMGWVSYELDPRLELFLGSYKVFGTREWTSPFAQTFGTERTMATTFFRPGFSPGAWVKGSFEETNVSYQAGVFTSYIGVPYAEATNKGSGVTGCVTLAWEPSGKYGASISDIEPHDRPTPRFGTTWVVGKVNRQSPDYPSEGDNSLLSLSDGTPLGALGALGDGTLIEAETIALATADYSVKYRGWTLYHEWMLRWIGNFDYDGPAPERGHLFDYGAILQGGYFVLPKTCEMYARSSFVSGVFGTGYEVGGGAAWFPLKQDRFKVTGELLYINNCPADNARTAYRAGETGVALMFQTLALF